MYYQVIFYPIVPKFPKVHHIKCLKCCHPRTSPFDASIELCVAQVQILFPSCHPRLTSMKCNVNSVNVVKICQK